MTTWIDHLNDSRGIRAVYGESLPSLDSVELRQATFQVDGATVALGVELSEFPRDPPAKWRKGHNRVHVRLDFFPVSDATLTGWGTVGKVAISIRKQDALLSVDVVGEQCRLSFRAQFIHLQEMTAYIVEE